RSFDLREGALKLYYNETDYLFFNIYKERKIIKALQYEMAVVRAVSFPQKDGLDSFGFELIKRYAEVQPAPVVPFKGQVPNPYRIDGLPVIISGNVLDSFAVSGLPDTVPSNLFELTFIYERNPGIVAIYCDPCRDKRTVKVLDDEPATVRRNNVFQTKDKDISISIDAASIDTFAFELQNEYKDVSSRPVVSRYPVPEKYRIDGLKVKINGEITNCYVGFSAPYIRTIPQNIFELTSIR
ncbi:MAG: hypothetical protein LBB73_01745, partial [Dysgonamonadaceae bacterium]|nr:hypothetical protein [Dysgonamonadaceae bacterium]